MSKLMFVPLSRFYAQRDQIGEDDVGRRRGGGGRRLQRHGGGGQRRGGGGQRKGGGPHKPQPQPRPRPQPEEEERRAAMDEGGGYEDDGYNEVYDEVYDELDELGEEYDPYDEFEPPSLAGRRGWNAAMALGEHVQVRAAEGRRAAVKQLEPGLWLVAELPDDEAVGAVALASIILFAAKKALKKMGVNLAEGDKGAKLKEAVREAVLKAKSRLKERRAGRKARREGEAEAQPKKLRLPRPVEVGCRDRRGR